MSASSEFLRTYSNELDEDELEQIWKDNLQFRQWVANRVMSRTAGTVTEQLRLQHIARDLCGFELVLQEREEKK